jgi:hypothetical protein
MKSTIAASTIRITATTAMAIKDTAIKGMATTATGTTTESQARRD